MVTAKSAGWKGAALVVKVGNMGQERAKMGRGVTMRKGGRTRV